MKVEDVMNKAFVVDPDINIRQAAKIMSSKGIGSLIVLKKNKIEGIITERDVMKNISNLGKKVRQVMTKTIVTIDSNNSLDNAAVIMAEKGVKRLPALDKGKLVGVLTATDIVANSDVLNEDFLLD